MEQFAEALKAVGKGDNHHTLLDIRREIRIAAKRLLLRRDKHTSLALLVEWLRESERAGQRIAFVNVPPQLLSIARVCGLDKILSLSR